MKKTLILYTTHGTRRLEFEDPQRQEDFFDAMMTVGWDDIIRAELFNQETKELKRIK